METGDKSWKWGIFYFNRDDSKIFVPKRYGFGYTLNFANPWSWVAVAILIATIALPLSIPTIRTRMLRHRSAG